MLAQHQEAEESLPAHVKRQRKLSTEEALRERAQQLAARRERGTTSP